MAALLAIVVIAGYFPVTLAGAGSAPTLHLAALTLPGLAASAPLDAITEIEAAPVPLTVHAPEVSADTLVSAIDTTDAAVASIERTNTSGATSVAAIPQVGTPSRSPRYLEYAVRSGDTISSIASRFGIGSNYIIWNNADVSNDPNSLEIGQKLQIPTVPGMIHSVQIGDTLSSIIARYDGDLQQTLDFRANNITDPNVVPVGELLLVVGGRNIPPPAPTFRPGDDIDFGGNWVWPTDSRTITSLFRIGGHNLGIDIGAVSGSPLRAAETGTVTFVGGDARFSYGLHVIIDHGGGYKTLYAHMSRFNVSLGEQVVAGQLIGRVGNTGRSTGPHLHFEINRYDIHLNPLAFLP